MHLCGPSLFRQIRFEPCSNSILMWYSHVTYDGTYADALGADFATAPLFWVLQKVGASGGGSAQGKWAQAVWACRLLHDSCELDVAVPKGNYALKIWQPLSGGRGCATFEFSVSITPAHESDTGTECIGADTLPASLPSQGGSLYWSKAHMLLPASKAGDGKTQSSLQVMYLRWYVRTSMYVCLHGILVLDSFSATRTGMELRSFSLSCLDSKSSVLSLNIKNVHKCQQVGQGRTLLHVILADSMQDSEASLSLESDGSGAEISTVQVDSPWNEQQHLSWSITCPRPTCDVNVRKFVSCECVTTCVRNVRFSKERKSF
jgi:hypothetical protein